MERVTIVCCSNNLKQFSTFEKSLKTQTEKYKLILIDNTDSKFSSCSKAFNSVVKSISTKFVIFSHQDIILDETDMLENFVNYLEKIDREDILGVAGGKKGLDYVKTNIRHGESKKRAGKERVSGMQECDTLDECFFGGYTECFIKSPFDEEICDNWHLYAVERCLNAKKNGNKVWVCDVPLIHDSKGKIDHKYNIGFYKLSKKYSKEFDYIKTTCAYAKTSLFYRELAYIRREISIKLGRY